VIPTTGILKDPIDKFYAYVGSHDGSELWLATAPHPLGPWEWQNCILTVEDTSFKGHISSPSAVIHKDQVYLYFHGSLPTMPQPTALALSDDGVNFEEYKCPVIFSHPNHTTSWYGQSTSYARIVKDGALFIATFQGNGLGRNIQAGGTSTVAGLAMSDDGINWRVAKRPLIGNPCGNRGPFGPILMPLWGRWMLIYEDKSETGMAASVSEGHDVAGNYESIGTIIPGPEGIKLGWAFPIFHDDKLIFLYGLKKGSYGGIYASIVDWSDVR